MNPVRMAAVLALAFSAAAHSQAPPATSQVVLVCEAAYLPARTVWTRTVAIEYDQQRVRSVLIDGVPVYTFAIRGTVILTSLDNERIQINTAAQSWSSDFRGVASAHGRCERGQPRPVAGAASTG